MSALGAEGRRFKSCLPDHISAVSRHSRAATRGLERKNESGNGAEVPGIVPDGFGAYLSEKVIARFWAKVDRRDERDCWDWSGSLTASGYGRFKVASYKQVQAHRVALTLGSGIERPDLMALHSCDRPSCCNPSHLRWGTAKDNSDDKVSRSRHRNGRLAGFTNPRCTLSPEQLIEIVGLIDTTYLSNGEIGQRFGLHHSSISKIRTGNAWQREVAAIRANQE